eukprot:323033_1
MSSVSEQDNTIKLDHLGPDERTKRFRILIEIASDRKDPDDVLKDALDTEDVDLLRFLFESEIATMDMKVEQAFPNSEEIFEWYYEDELPSDPIYPLSYA